MSEWVSHRPPPAFQLQPTENIEGIFVGVTAQAELKINKRGKQEAASDSKLQW